MDANRAVADELRAARGRRRWSQHQLAAASKVPYSTLRKYESGERAIPLPALFALCWALGMDAPELLRDAMRKNPQAFAVLDVEQGEDLIP